MNVAQKIWLMVSDPIAIRELIRFRFGDYLLETGWIESVRRGSPVNVQGDPIPWMTLPFIHFLEPRLTPSMSLFEFGSGNSTKYFEQRLNTVVAVEHDRSWYERIRSEIRPGTEIVFCDLNDGDRYVTAAARQQCLFDIIVIDGRKRVSCMEHSIGSLSPSGVIIFDDTDRAEYNAGIQSMGETGWKTIDFWGMAPGLHYKKCTSILYRHNNCLGI
jgi:hypothetical protein